MSILETRPSPTDLRVAKRHLNVPGTRPIHVWGKLLPGLPGRRVRLQGMVGRGWETLSTTRTGKLGREFTGILHALVPRAQNRESRAAARSNPRLDVSDISTPPPEEHACVFREAETKFHCKLRTTESASLLARLLNEASVLRGFAKGLPHLAARCEFIPRVDMERRSGLFFPCSRAATIQNLPAPATLIFIDI